MRETKDRQMKVAVFASRPLICWLCLCFQMFSRQTRNLKLKKNYEQTCPKCDGDGKTFRRINRGFDGCESGDFPCQFCDGDGKVEIQKAESFALGEKLREFRMIRNVMMRECADKYGIETMDWLSLENGTAHKRKVQAAFDWIQDAELQSGCVPSVKEQF